MNGGYKPILVDIYLKESQVITDMENVTDPYKLQESIPDQDEYTEEAYNDYISIQVILPTDGVYDNSIFVE